VSLGFELLALLCLPLCAGGSTKDDDGLGAGVIVAIIIGVLVVLAIIGFGVMTMKKRSSHSGTTKAGAGDVDL